MISRVEANVGSEPLFSKFEIFSVLGAGFENHHLMLVTWLHSRMHFRDMATKGDSSAEGRITVLAFEIESFRISCRYFWLLRLLNLFLCLWTSMFPWWGYHSFRCFSKLSFLVFGNHLFASQIYLIFIFLIALKRSLLKKFLLIILLINDDRSFKLYLSLNLWLVLEVSLAQLLSYHSRVQSLVLNKLRRFFVHWRKVKVL